MEFKMKKIAMLLMLASVSIPSLSLADDGYQTVGNLKIKYPHKFTYSKSLTNKYFGKLNQSGKKAAAFEAEGACGYQLVELYVMNDKPPFGSEKMVLELNDIMSKNENVIASSVEPIDISGFKSATGSIVIKESEYNKFINNVQINDTNRYWALLFAGKQESSKDVAEFQSCIKEVIDTIEIVK